MNASKHYMKMKNLFHTHHRHLLYFNYFKLATIIFFMTLKIHAFSFTRMPSVSELVTQRRIQNKNTVFSLMRISSSQRKTTTSRNMIQVRGLEDRVEGATPTPGGMTLYIKAGPDGTSPGDCPFAHYVRMVLSEKSLEYELRPSTPETKPNWLIESYGGSMPALRHRKECYVESDVICQYLDFFFEEPALTVKKKEMNVAKDCTDGFFGCVARYLKHTNNSDKEDLTLKSNLEDKLGELNEHLSRDERSGPYFTSDGETFTLVDCSLAPQLHHLKVGLKAFKDNAVDLETSFPAVWGYMTKVFERSSFQEAIYEEDVVIWGWKNARGEG